MSKYTKDDIIRMVEEEGIDFIRMQFTDIFGQAKNVAITASQIQKAVNNQISIDGSSIEGFTRIHESDQYLYPDLDTFTVLSWYEQQGKVARLLCDVCNPDGTPFIGDPRGALKRVLRPGPLTWAIPSMWGRNANSSCLRWTKTANPPPRPMTRPVTST